MGDNSKISWTDATWNPLLGCERVSPGCDGCYAITTATIRAKHPNIKVSAAFEGLTARNDEGRIDWTGRINLLPERLLQPLGWRRPRRIFVNSQADLFYKDVPDEFIAQVFAVMAAAPQHTFQLLTKRHGRMRSLLRSEGFRTAVDTDPVGNLVREAARGPIEWPLPNVHLGVSVEDQKWADVRIPALLDTPAAVRWLSCEPLIGPVDLGIGDPHRGHDSDDVNGYPHPRVCLTCSTDDGDKVSYFRREPGDSGIDWTVVGGESGPGARPMNLDWAASIVGQCQSARVPVFVKQLGSRWGKSHQDVDTFPEALRVREYPKGSTPTSTSTTK